jgi:DtxR family transcriptional regulator, manganese transport regulator
MTGKLQTLDDDDARAAEARAETFHAARVARKSELSEDYVELIADLIAQFGEARPVDIAARLGVTAPTVAKTLDRLARDGLVTRARYRSVFLTDLGQTLASDCQERHAIVVAFLIRLGLDAETAEKDAEGIEHHVSARTLQLFRDFAGKSRQTGT